ncbi:MAG: hypothetical protein JNL70_11760 [Saprospiraceae bacterium]|nr:hypothetical protein [Saprospiraceae bacterium]
MTLSFIPNLETQLLIDKADNGCAESQLTVATYYLGSPFLHKDRFKSYYYHCAFLKQDYEKVIAKRLTSPIFHISTFAVAGLLALNLDKYQEAKQHYLSALDYANRYLTSKECQKLAEKYHIYQRLDEIEQIENGTLVPKELVN